MNLVCVVLLKCASWGVLCSLLITLSLGFWEHVWRSLAGPRNHVGLRHFAVRRRDSAWIMVISAWLAQSYLNVFPGTRCMVAVEWTMFQYSLVIPWRSHCTMVANQSGTRIGLSWIVDLHNKLGNSRRPWSTWLWWSGASRWWWRIPTKLCTGRTGEAARWLCTLRCTGNSWTSNGCSSPLCLYNRNHSGTPIGNIQCRMEAWHWLYSCTPAGQTM